MKYFTICNLVRIVYENWLRPILQIHFPKLVFSITAWNICKKTSIHWLFRTTNICVAQRSVKLSLPCVPLVIVLDIVVACFFVLQHPSKINDVANFYPSTLHGSLPLRLLDETGGLFPRPICCSQNHVCKTGNRGCSPSTTVSQQWSCNRVLHGMQ